MGAVRSILDNDLYKFTMQKAVLSYRQRVPVRYVFSNRRPEGRFNAAFGELFAVELDALRELRLTGDERNWLRAAVPWLDEEYIEYLSNYRFDPREVRWRIEHGELLLEINGPWERTILWEVPLMAVISEVFFRTCDINWSFDEQSQARLIKSKAERLAGTCFADFGTRRRRNFETQDLVVRHLTAMDGFRGTSNVHLAHKHGVAAMGTMAHEWIMGISALEGLRHANRHAFRIWSDVYHGNLGIALTDTFGTAAFFEDFDGYLARLFDGVRHDSGDPIEFAESVIAHYKKLGVKPLTRTIVFSDALDVELARRIWSAVQGRIQASFGIGTNFTNDYQGSRALNMVIKMWSCGGVPVVKLSDAPTKAIGDRDALRVARWTFFQTPLDADHSLNSRGTP